MLFYIRSLKHELKTKNIESRSLKRHNQIASVFFLDQDLQNVNSAMSTDYGLANQVVIGSCLEKFVAMFPDQGRNEECVTSLLHITINRYMNKEEIIFTIIVEHIRIRTRSKISILLLLLRINTNPKYFYQSYHLNRSELDTPTGLDLIITNC